jgi:hypothetical protein
MGGVIVLPGGLMPIDETGTARETVLGVFLERPWPGSAPPARPFGASERDLVFLCFYDDGVVLKGFAPEAQARERALATARPTTDTDSGFIEKGTYVRAGHDVKLRFTSLSRTLNFDWDDKGYYEEDQRFGDYSGAIEQDRLTLDWSERWETETFVAPPPRQGRIACERITP